MKALINRLEKQMKKRDLLKYFDESLLDKLFGFCYARTNDSYEAEELCSDIIYSLVKAANSDGEIESVYPFIWRVARNVYADFTDKTLVAENHIDNLVKTAFGKKLHPDWNDFTAFLEERCIPKGRSGLREYLESIGVESYSPIEIIQKTHGRMAEDNQWLEMEEI